MLFYGAWISGFVYLEPYGTAPVPYRYGTVPCVTVRYGTLTISDMALVQKDVLKIEQVK